MDGTDPMKAVRFHCSVECKTKGKAAFIRMQVTTLLQSLYPYWNQTMGEERWTGHHTTGGGL